MKTFVYFSFMLWIVTYCNAASTKTGNQGDRYIKYDDFYQQMMLKVRGAKGDEERREIFREFDKDGDEMISSFELYKVMTDLGLHPTDDEVDAMICEADLNSDGHVDYNEFVEQLTS